MNLHIHEDIKLLMDKDIKMNGTNIIARSTIAIVEGIMPACDKCKRKFVDNIEVEPSYNFKEDPLMTKETLEIKAMR